MKLIIITLLLSFNLLACLGIEDELEQVEEERSEYTYSAEYNLNTDSGGLHLDDLNNRLLDLQEELDACNSDNTIEDDF